MEWDDPVGQEMRLGGNRRGRVVGIVKDFHIQSMVQPIEPLAIYLKQDSQIWFWRLLSVKIHPGDMPSTLKYIEETLHRFAPNYPFEYSFFDDVFNRTFKADQKMGSLFGTFALIAILIACLGLFSTQKRNKEIGIRKVLGARYRGLLFCLDRSS